MFDLIAIPLGVVCGIWRCASGIFFFTEPSIITSSSLTLTALSGNSSTSILAHGISMLPPNSSSFGVTETEIFGLTSTFPIFGILTLKRFARALIVLLHASSFRQSAEPSKYRSLSEVWMIPERVELAPWKCIAKRPSVISNGIETDFARKLLKPNCPCNCGASTFPPIVNFALILPSTDSPPVNNGLIKRSESWSISICPDNVRDLVMSFITKSVANRPLFSIRKYVFRFKLLSAKRALILSGLAVIGNVLPSDKACVNFKWCELTSKFTCGALFLNHAASPFAERMPDNCVLLSK